MLESKDLEGAVGLESPHRQVEFTGFEERPSRATRTYSALGNENSTALKEQEDPSVSIPKPDTIPSERPSTVKDTNKAKEMQVGANY